MNKKDILYLLLFIFFWFIFFRKLFFQGMVPIPGNLLVSFFSPWKEEQWSQYPGGVYKQGLFGFDTIRQIYPWRKFSTEQILKLQWPLWNPYQFAGAPHLANFQTAIFYPLNLLYLVFPQIWAWTTLLVIQPLLAAIFMYMLARKLKISRIGAFFASFAWAFSLTTSVWLIWNIHAHQFMYLPLILYFIEKFKEKNKLTDIFWLVGLLTFVFIAGHPQIFIFILIFCGIYFFYRTRKLKEWLLIIVAVLALTAVVWLPLAEYYRLASREIPSSEFSFLKTLLPWQNLTTLIAPDFFGNPTTANHWGKNDYTETSVYAGITTFLLALFAIFSKEKSRSKFFIYTIPVIFALCLNWFLPRIFLFLKIPVLSSSAATRILFLVNFSLSLLAGFGIDTFFKKREIIPPITFLGIIFILLWVFVLTAGRFLPYQNWFENLQVMRRNLILPTVVFIVSSLIFFLIINFRKIRKEVSLILVLLMALDLFYVSGKVIPFTYKELVFPPHPLIEFLQTNSHYYRYAGSEASDIDSNFATFYGLFSTEGYDTLYPRYYGELVWAGYSGKYNEDISRTTVVFPPARSETQYRLEDLLGVKYILEKDDDYKSDWYPNYDKFPPERFQLVWQRKNWKVYENKQVLPRAFLADNFLVLDNKEKIIETIYKKEFDPSKTVILEEKPQFVINPIKEEGKTEIISYTPNQVKIKTKAKGDKILFLSDVFYPGWKVYINGKEGKVYKANQAFRAVFVTGGEHEVVFSYEPKIFRIGMIISSITIFSFFIIILINQKKKINFYLLCFNPI